MLPARRRAALLVLPLALGLAGCSGAADGAEPAAGGPVTVAASDTECVLSRTEVPTGTVEFAVTNGGSAVTEFYVYGDGERVLGEVENIGPGLTRTVHIELPEPGTYATACKPGMVGDGIRGELTVTGSSAAPTSEDPDLASATAEYQRYVADQADELIDRTTEFVALVTAGRVAEAKALYPAARTPWERIEPVAESFGDLDPRIDGREDVLAEGMDFTGYHRLEKDLWESGLQPDSGAVADQLLADVTEVAARAKAVELTPLQLANGSKALLDEIATGKITGEEERYSHTDLWDFAANLEGSREAVRALRPFVAAADPALAERLDSRGQALADLLATHRDGDGFVAYPSLTPAEVKALTEALDAFAEPVATLAGLVARG